MIEASFFTGWARGWSKDGVELRREADASLGHVAIRYCVTPLIPAAVMLAQMQKATEAECDETSYVFGQGGITSAGEHYVLIGISGRRRDDRRIERRAGIVYADRYMTVVDGTFEDGPAAPLFRSFVADLTRELPLRDGGRIRFRRCVHRVPVGWAVRTRDFTTHLFAPDGLAFMTLLPAEPLNTHSVAKKFVYEDVIARFEPEGQILAHKHTTPNGLSGDIVWAQGTGATRGSLVSIGTAILRDDAFLYVARYERPHPRHTNHEAALTALIDSLEPVPPATDPTARLAGSYWLG